MYSLLLCHLVYLSFTSVHLHCLWTVCLIQRNKINVKSLSMFTGSSFAPKNLDPNTNEDSVVFRPNHCYFYEMVVR